MDADNIRRLLKKFEAAETCLEEENALKEYFVRENDFPEEWMPYKHLFTWQDTLSQVVLSETFSKNIKEKIEYSEHNSLRSVKTLDRRMNAIVRWSIAASVLLAIGFWFLQPDTFIDKAEPQMAHEETFDTPEEAYRQTMEALAFVSNKLNKGKITASQSLGRLKRLDDVIPN